MIYFKYNGEPKGKGRPKVTIRGGHAHAYTPKSTKEFEDAIKFEFLASNCEKTPVYPKDVPIKVRIDMAMPIPKSYSAKKREQCEKGIIQHTKKPDIDNVVKAVLDALQGEAYETDAQVVEVFAEKFYAEEPYVQVSIYPRDWGHD